LLPAVFFPFLSFPSFPLVWSKGFLHFTNWRLCFISTLRGPSQSANSLSFFFFFFFFFVLLFSPWLVCLSEDLFAVGLDFDRAAHPGPFRRPNLTAAIRSREARSCPPFISSTGLASRAIGTRLCRGCIYILPPTWEITNRRNLFKNH